MRNTGNLWHILSSSDSLSCWKKCTWCWWFQNWFFRIYYYRLMMFWIETIKMFISLRIEILYLLFVIKILWLDDWLMFFWFLSIEFIFEKLIFSRMECPIKINIFTENQWLGFNIIWFTSFKNLGLVDKFSALVSHFFINRSSSATKINTLSSVHWVLDKSLSSCWHSSSCSVS